MVEKRNKMETSREVSLSVTVGTSSTAQAFAKPTHRLQLRREEVGSGVRCIYLRGRLDILGIREIELKFAVLVATQQPLIVDLSEVELITSDGLGMLISSANELKTHGKMMILLKPNRYVEKVVRMSCLDHLLPIEYDMAEALRKIRAK